MDHMIYLAMSAARQMMNGQAAAAHNLANANTTGFKADYAAYRAMPLFGEGYASRVFALEERPGIDFSSGALDATGNELDIALMGEGFIAVQAPDGSEAYTRAGALQLDALGQLTTAEAPRPLRRNGRYQASARSPGSVTVPGVAIARRAAARRYVAGSIPVSLAVSIRL